MRHHGFPQGHPRFRHKAVAPYCSVPAANEPVVVSGGTIYLPLNYQARVRVYARDESGIDKDSEGGAFASSDDGIFRVVSIASVFDPNTGISHWEVLLAAVAVGTATLSEQVDAQVTASTGVNMSDVPITDSLTVVVYQVATELVLYYTEEGSADELSAVIFAYPQFRIPVNKNATIRVEGRNGRTVVPLSSVVWSNGGSTNFHFVATSDPSIVTLVTDAQHIVEAANVTADGDPSPSAASLSLDFQVGVDAEIATNLVEFYAVEPR